MLTSWLMLVLAAAVAPWPLETPSTPPDAPEELYARLETMTPPARQAWVQAMLTRLDRANQVFLDPWEVRRQHARVETAMQPFVEGKPDWRRRAEFLNHELRVGQQAAVEHLSRQYRVEIYNNYRFSRPEYNRRRAAARAARRPMDRRGRASGPGVQGGRLAAVGGRALGRGRRVATDPQFRPGIAPGDLDCRRRATQGPAGCSGAGRTQTGASGCRRPAAQAADQSGGRTAAQSGAARGGLGRGSTAGRGREAEL